MFIITSSILLIGTYNDTKRILDKRTKSKNTTRES